MKKLYQHGLILGKFSPFHEGHKLMIDYASEMCEKVYVLINTKTDVPIETRIGWLKEQYKGTNVEIHHIKYFDEIPDPIAYDEYGTAVDEDFWKEWINGINRFFWFKFDAVFSNDQYGKELAKRLNTDWMPVDPGRTTQKISATKIREDVHFNYDYLCEVTKPYYQKTIAVVGPESTGKSTLTKELAEQFSYGYAHEYGRTLSEIRHNELSENDFRAIGIGQAALIDSAHKQNQFVITDTEAFTTYLYAEVFIEGVSENLMGELLDNALKQEIDLYILLAPTVEWVDDGTRVMQSIDKRQYFFNRIKDFLDKENCKYVVIDDKEWTLRRVSATFNVRNFRNCLTR